MTNNLSETQINAAIADYLDKNWGAILADMESLISIPSFRQDELADPEHGAPFGPGPRAALTKILEIASRMGFETTDLDGYIGWADYAGNADANRQIGIIGHVDVVPAGPGWDFEPFALTRREGYVLGRGTTDDKGPVIITLHALNMWKQLGVKFPYDVRFLFGAAEETSMEEVAYYRSRYADPDFLFTPDAEFPVCYGEKGHYDGTLTSAPITDGVLLELEGGTAPNAVPGLASAVIRMETDAAPASEYITFSSAGPGLTRIEAHGKSEHASTPQGGINAIALLVDFLLQAHLLSPAEEEFLCFDQHLLNYTDGSGFDCACADEDFGALTMVGGMISLKNGVITQTVDARYPSCTNAEEITRRISKLAAAEAPSITVACTGDMPTFLVDKDSPEIQALLAAYNSATGEQAEPFTMGGGTYARMFSNAASFGPEKPWIETPDWVGGMHGPNEGVSEESLKEAFRIYAKTLPLF